MTPLSVILAEDDPDIQLVARLALKRAGFLVRVANNGVEAVAMVREQPPDAILLDWMMPEMDGLQACAILKADPATAHIPIVFLTAKTQDSEIQRGMSLGASGYVTKPFDALTLGDQVRAIIAAQAP
jgi:two-component system, OmpR family, alkaline phosphatase synthesis response regulator PhoP